MAPRSSRPRPHSPASGRERPPEEFSMDNPFYFQMNDDFRTFRVIERATGTSVHTYIPTLAAARSICRRLNCLT